MDIFCKIINKEVNSYTIYEDDIVKVFLDVNQKHKGHTLIIPKKHYVNLFDIDTDTLNYIFKVARNIAVLLKEALNYDGITLLQNNDYGQEVKHFHLHLIPTYEKENENSNIEEIYNIIKSKSSTR